MESGSLVIDLGLYIDQLTVLLLILVTGVSGVVHVYSSRYMLGDPRYSRFFAVIALFTFAMIMLVMSSNLLMMYVFWEVMGLCSYLLISHAAERKSAGQAATKAFLVNAVADVGLGFGVILTFATFGTLDIQTILGQAESISGQTINILGWAGLDVHVQTLTLITLFLFAGALGKSAQVPFHVWLPFAMEAPTPVSALIHAATMVNAGPFLLARLSPLVVLSPAAMTVIAVIGAITALFAAVVSLTQSDIKKILAYSTISQIGFMIMTCGLGAFVVAIFHLLAHGFYKAFFFLSTGNALASVQAHGHAPAESTHGSKEPSMAPLFIGALALACLPPFVIFSGPYQHMWTVQNFAAAKVAFWVIGLATVFFSAMYLFRGVVSLFQHGPSGGTLGGADPARIRPQIFSPSHFVGVVLGAGATVFLLMLLWTWFAEFLSPALAQPIPSHEPASPGGFSLGIIVSLVVAVCGWGCAYWLHVNPRQTPFGQTEWGKTLYVLFLNKFYVDEIYDVYVVQPTLRLARWSWKTVDLGGIDRVVTGMAVVSISLARWLWNVVDVSGIDRFVVEVGRQSSNFARWLWQVIDVCGIEENAEGMGHQADSTGPLLQKIEPRTLQHHLFIIVFWLISVIGLFYLLV
jgi:NADH-quinone oxidoreductase subunit L